MDDKLRILLCEDDENLGMLLREYLQAKGYNADLFPDGEVGFKAFLKSKYDLVVTDVMMPRKDGFTLAQEIRQANAEVPIIFLTAKTLKEDILEGFKIGADDYITKPFSMDELVARISAHLRREERKHEASSLRFDDELIINYDSHTVFYKEKQLEFSNKEFEIIRLLSQNAGMVFDRETIYEKLWGYDGEGDSIVVKEHIRKIRNKLSAYTDKNYIQTVWGVGYRWEK